MCSRYELHGTFEEIELRFNIPTQPENKINFNGLEEIRPTAKVPIITNKIMNFMIIMMMSIIF